MNKRWVYILIFSLIMIGGSIFEFVFSNYTIDKLIADTQSIKTQIIENSSITENLNEEISDVDEFWTSQENILCIMFNHKDMLELGSQITQVKTYISQNDLDNSIIHLDMLIFYINGLKHIIELSYQNIF